MSPEQSAGSAAAVADPQALIRLGTTLRAIRDELRTLDLDDSATAKLRFAHDQLVAGICETLSPALQDELSAVAVPLDGTPSSATIRLAQSQLLGWIEGLFVGLQATALGQRSAGELPSPAPENGARSSSTSDPSYL